jgi:hypothetical protein
MMEMRLRVKDLRRFEEALKRWYIIGIFGKGGREGFGDEEGHLYSIGWATSNRNHGIPVMGIISQF